MVTETREILPGLLRGEPQPHPRPAASCRSNPLSPMKNDYSFKLVVAIILAGVIVALTSPSQALPSADSTATEANHASHLTE
jgi:hypothetical protein